MKKEVYDYFEDLQNIKLTRDKGIILKDKNIKYLKEDKHNISIYQIDQRPYFVKEWEGLQSIHAISASTMYNNIGVITPPIDLLRNPSSHAEHEDGLWEITQSIYSIPTIDAIPASKILNRFFNETQRNYESTWNFLTNRQIKQNFLSVMTKECYEELINMVLLDELRAEIDRHSDNYFLIKPRGTERYTGVIAIDMGNSELAHCPPTTQNQFNNFLYRLYPSYTLTGQEDHASYLERINTIRDLLQSGQLSSSNIKTLRAGVNYDYPKEMKSTCKRYHLGSYTKQAHTPCAYAWEHIQNTLGRDLED